MILIYKEVCINIFVFKFLFGNNYRITRSCTNTERSQVAITLLPSMVMWLQEAARRLRLIDHVRLNKGLLGRGGKFQEDEGKKCMINKGCLAMQIRVSKVIRVVSLPGTEASLQMEISFRNVNFLVKGKFILYF